MQFREENQIEPRQTNMFDVIISLTLALKIQQRFGS